MFAPLISTLSTLALPDHDYFHLNDANSVSLFDFSWNVKLGFMIIER